ncbi:NAD(P)-dependent oxidoreductase [Paenibacillus sp. CGMCC 1.16610]|uniref:NAD(P)H-binding protein n=1 Tax=Paenibacillus anseongense TaxID=2682845 RepID=A0ABW9UKA8_9BACL|nr:MULTISPECIES: NAD(P)-dependent oxidoreductase [Paenibacillus]MBA2936701.1 NAD(P)-dependent oxidoreductase [Paenibacillus sp. CGMCC 1.16610]MVQ39695.1 NAD(P)H-binding protein [Paenibacillus anseongense]
MKIAIIGATGKAGKVIMQEALSRGHEVAAFVRSVSKVQESDVHAVEKNIFDLTADDLKPYDVVVNAFNAAPGLEHQHVEAGKVLIQALQANTHTKLVVVGGAGSLFVDQDKTTRLFDTENFPALYLSTAKNMGENLNELLSTTNIVWTYISPSAFFDSEGIRTGEYTAGKDHLLVNSQGQSYISYADYAIALLDEIENPKHVNQRFTVGSK